MNETRKARTTKPRRTIVSSAHLVSERAAGLSEFEYGLILAGNAFNRWILRCMAAAGHEDLGVLDILALHSVNHRAREKRLADICFVLGIEDTHTVTYALRKLTRLGLIAGERRGKEIFYTTTDAGREACRRYREVREDCLVNTFGAFAGASDGEIADLAELLRALSGFYDQAARAAASL